MNKIIHCKALLNCSSERAFCLFTKNEEIITWLTEKSEIEPWVGGKYELFWDKNDNENNSTSRLSNQMRQTRFTIVLFKHAR